MLQSPFFKGKERLADSSVEEHITADLLPAFRAEAHKFITAGGDLGLCSVQAVVASTLKGWRALLLLAEGMAHKPVPQTSQ